MKLTLTTGDVLTQQVDAIVNTVNCVGVMGKGVALQFKKAYPENYKAYVNACKAGEVQIGKMFIYDISSIFSKRKYIVNFPTKSHWRNPSRLEYIQEGLVDLVAKIKKLCIKSIAIPPLGCGNGGLNWQIVKPIILQALSIPEFSDLEILLFEPSESINGNSTHHSMSKLNAAICRVIERYKRLDYSLSHLEVQKLIYFFEYSGKYRSLDFQKNKYGPFSKVLEKRLDDIDGVYIKGVKSHNEATITVLPEVIKVVDAYIEKNKDLSSRYERVSDLIKGFENPFSLELLSTVHWVCAKGNAKDLDEVIQKISEWSPRKKQIFLPQYIKIAYERLHDKNWI